jgi:hypothetical protein
MSKIYDALQHLEAQRKAMETGETPKPPPPATLSICKSGPRS